MAYTLVSVCASCVWIAAARWMDVDEWRLAEETMEKPSCRREVGGMIDLPGWLGPVTSIHSIIISSPRGNGVLSAFYYGQAQVALGDPPARHSFRQTAP